MSIIQRILPLTLGLLACTANSAVPVALGTEQAAPHELRRYQITDLGTLPNCDVTGATAVNDAGWVVGYAYTFVPPGHGGGLTSRPFLWHDGKMVELPELGGEYGAARTINGRGDIGGYANTKDFQRRPVLWHRSKGEEVESLSNQSGAVTALLENGTAVGEVFAARHRRAAAWKAGKMQILGNPQDEENSASGVNSAGTVVGYFIPEGGSGQSAWSPGDRHAAMWKNGRQIALPDRGGISNSEAINEKEVAVGWVIASHEHRACVWKDGRVEMLPTSTSGFSEAHSINKDGLIVGQADVRDTANQRNRIACLWEEGHMQNLNDLIPADTGWDLSQATCISDNGQIVGYGTYSKYPNHLQRAFLLTPVEVTTR